MPPASDGGDGTFHADDADDRVVGVVVAEVEALLWVNAARLHDGLRSPHTRVGLRLHSTRRRRWGAMAASATSMCLRKRCKSASLNRWAMLDEGMTPRPSRRFRGFG